MTWLTRCSGTLRRLDRLEQLCRGRTLPELVDLVEAEHADLAPPGRWGMQRLLWSWPLWKTLHRGARQHPCLYFALLALAYEKKAGRSAEINVGLSADRLNATDGHCWLTCEGKKLYEWRGPSPHEYRDCLGREGPVVYWWRRAIVAPNPDLHSKRPRWLRRWLWPT